MAKEETTTKEKPSKTSEEEEKVELTDLQKEVNKVAGVQIANEMDLADLEELGWVQVRPKDAEELAEHRQALCVPYVFSKGKVIAVLSGSQMVAFSEADKITHEEFSRRAVQYYWTDQKEDTAEKLWERMDDYRYKKYGRVWFMTHDKDAEEKATKETEARLLARGEIEPKKPKKTAEAKSKSGSDEPKAKAKPKASAKDIVEETKAKAAASGKTVRKKSDATS